MSDPVAQERTATLKAGRELDDRVAVSVMGWEVFTLSYFGTEDETPRMRELHDWLTRVGIESVGVYYIDVERDFWRDSDDFQPSTDIAAAWEVVEKVREHFNFELDGDDVWQVWFRPFRMRDGYRVYYGIAVSDSGDTAPLAICLAALKAVAESGQ